MTDNNESEPMDLLEKSISNQDMTQFEEETRSIVYGNPIKNKYGNFRCYCAAVSNKGTKPFKN